MSIVPRATRYKCTRNRVEFKKSVRRGRVVANFMFHRRIEGYPPVDFPVAVEVFEKSRSAILENPEVIAVMYKDRPLAIKVGGRYTPSYLRLPFIQRVRFYSAALYRVKRNSILR